MGAEVGVVLWVRIKIYTFTDYTSSSVDAASASEFHR